MPLNYNSAIIYYFSGTGNAKQTATWMADELIKQGLDTQLKDISSLKGEVVPEPLPKSLIGFISPTHGFHFPQIMRSFIDRFPKVKQCQAFVMNTRAGLRIGKVFIPGLSGVLHYWSALRLVAKGFKVVGLRPVDLPSNWISLHPAVRPNGMQKIFNHVEPKVRRFAYGLAYGQKSFRAVYDLIQDLIIAPVALLYILFARYFFAKSFIASSDCDNCGLCKQLCPVDAIKQKDQRMYWTLKCESCMKCMTICPKQAIETAHGFFIGASVLITTMIIWFIEWFNQYLEWTILERSWFVWATKSILLIPLLFLAYNLMHYLMRFGFFERLFVLSSLTHYKFWGRFRVPKANNK